MSGRPRWRLSRFAHAARHIAFSPGTRAVFGVETVDADLVPPEPAESDGARRHPDRRSGGSQRTSWLTRFRASPTADSNSQHDDSLLEMVTRARNFVTLVAGDIATRPAHIGQWSARRGALVPMAA